MRARKANLEGEQSDAARRCQVISGTMPGSSSVEEYSAGMCQQHAQQGNSVQITNMLCARTEARTLHQDPRQPQRSRAPIWLQVAISIDPRPPTLRINDDDDHDDDTCSDDDSAITNMLQEHCNTSKQHN